MHLRDMSLDEMADAAVSLATCLRERAMEDAAGWIVQLSWAMHRHQFHEQARMRSNVWSALKELAGKPS